MDINMPGINGIEATRRIVEAHPEVKVILLSTYVAEDLPADARTSGSGPTPRSARHARTDRDGAGRADADRRGGRARGRASAVAALRGEAVGVHDCERAGKRVMELVDLAGKLSGAGLATVLILILIGGWKGLWVFGWVQMRERAMLEQQRDQLFKEREEWKTLALRATATADKAVDHAAVLQKAG